jgi:hypothetical protein
MNHKTYKPIAIIVLLSFSWTFGGLFDIAYAFKNSPQTSDIRQQTKAQRPEEKFQKAIEDIEKILTDTVTDTDTKKARVKVKKTEIEALDVDIRKLFAETGKKLKDAKLPDEILQRHYKFVKHYEDNLNVLRTNFETIEKTRTKEETDTEIERTKTFLEKVKPPKKYRPLDPNKLPHRTPEEKKVILEEWKAPEKRPIRLEPLKKSEIQDHQPILVASNESLDGLLSQDSKYSHNAVMPEIINRASSVFLDSASPLAGEDGGEGATPNFELRTQNSIQVASAGFLSGLLSSTVVQATNPPTDADLAETIEVQFTPAIRTKAAELGNKPVKIYNWVRNNIEYVPTFGSVQGADMCLRTKQCNDIDTASLLIALLRVSGIPARYAYGVVERDIDKVMNWVGGFTDPMAALNLLATAGIPVKGMTVGGQIKYVQMEHVWVEARVLYGPYRGAGGVDNIPTWIPLDASYKQYNYTSGIDIKTAVPFDAQSFIDQIKSTATINEAQGYVTNVNSLLVQQAMQDYQTRVQNYITQNYPNAMVGDILGKKEIIKKEYPYLLGSLPIRTISKMWEQPVLPDNLRHKITFTVTKDIYDSELGTPINIAKSLPELAGKKITLSYSPATPQDEAVINSYLPQPHPDGTPIQPNELPSSLPAYLINLKPELRIDGVIVATGTAVGMGQNETFAMTFYGPGLNASDVITNEVKAGNYLGIALDLGKVSEEQIISLKTKLEATKAKLESQDFTNMTKDDVVGDLLYTTALSYHAEVGLMKYMAAKTMGLLAIILPSETIFSFDLKSNYAFGIPISVSPSALSMDADRIITLVKALDGNKETPVLFMLNSGTTDSFLEHSVPEQLFSTPDNPAQGISAVKALQIANDQGIPIYTINQSNINTILPQLQLDSETIADIQNAVNAGKIVTVSKTDINFNGWTGVGYIIIDPTTGAGAYMISGGLSGGILLAALLFVTALLLLAIAVAIGPIAFIIVSLLLPIYLAFQAWLATQASESVKNCIKAIVITLGLILMAIPRIATDPLSIMRLTVTIYGAINRVNRDCFGVGVAY